MKHIPRKTNRGNPIFYYAVFKLKNGGEGFTVMSKEEIEDHAKKYSKSYGSSPWQTEFDEMAKKTVLKKLLKYMPLKTEFVRAVTQDETIKEFDNVADNSNMTEKPNEFFDAEYEINEETGEVTK